MRIKDLNILLSNIPKEAIVYTEDAHGPEQASGAIYVSTDQHAYHYGENMKWVNLKDVADVKEVTAIMIG